MSHKPIIEVSEVAGRKLLMKPLRHNEIVSLAMFSPTGSIFDPAGQAGTSQLAQSVMVKGAGNRDARQFAEAVEDLGSSISGSITHDFSKISLVCSSRCFDETLALYGDVVNSPRFADDELEKERQLQIADARLSDDNQFHYTHRHFLPLLYGEHPYSQLNMGQPETIEQITADGIRAAHQLETQSAESIIVAVGNFNSEALVGQLEEILPPLNGEPSAAPALSESDTVQTERLELTKECEQAFLVSGWRLPPPSHPDYPALRLLAAILGEGMGSRMFMQLRDEQGLAYATGAQLVARQQASHLVMYIGTKPERIDESLAGFKAIHQQAQRELPTADELERARNFVLGKFLFAHQKNSRQGHYLGYFEMMGLGWEADAKYGEQLQNVDAAKIQSVAQKYLSNQAEVVLQPITQDAAVAT
jgi:predicted Zn-dependent peptidase